MSNRSVIFAQEATGLFGLTHRLNGLVPMDFETLEDGTLFCHFYHFHYYVQSADEDKSFHEVHDICYDRHSLLTSHTRRSGPFYNDRQLSVIAGPFFYWKCR